MKSEEEFREGRYSAHYYGNKVRILFLAGGIIMLLTLPFFKHLLPVPVFVSVLSIILIGVAAGFTSPRQRSVMVLNMGISFIAFAVFEYHAATAYSNTNDPLFWIDQVLALLFFVALYFSTKTVRGNIFKD